MNHLSIPKPSTSREALREASSLSMTGTKTLPSSILDHPYALLELTPKFDQEEFEIYHDVEEYTDAITTAELKELVDQGLVLIELNSDGETRLWTNFYRDSKEFPKKYSKAKRLFDRGLVLEFLADSGSVH